MVSTATKSTVIVTRLRDGWYVYNGEEWRHVDEMNPDAPFEQVRIAFANKGVTLVLKPRVVL